MLVLAPVIKDRLLLDGLFGILERKRHGLGPGMALTFDADLQGVQGAARISARDVCQELQRPCFGLDAKKPQAPFRVLQCAIHNL